MTRSIDFGATVKHGIRAVQPDLVIYARCERDGSAKAPKVGLIIGKPVGSAVQRHRVARRLRHIARTLVEGLDQSQRVVIRALPTSRDVGSAGLEQQLRAGLRRIQAAGSAR
jgi:ribonuclease P protein component